MLILPSSSEVKSFISRRNGFFSFSSWSSFCTLVKKLLWILFYFILFYFFSCFPQGQCNAQIYSEEIYSYETLFIFLLYARQIIGWVITNSCVRLWITQGEWLRLTLWKDDLIRALSKATANWRPGYHSDWRERTEQGSTTDELQSSFPGKQRIRTILLHCCLSVPRQPASKNHGRLSIGRWLLKRYRTYQIRARS